MGRPCGAATSNTSTSPRPPPWPCLRPAPGHHDHDDRGPPYQKLTPPLSKETTPQGTPLPPNRVPSEKGAGHELVMFGRTPMDGGRNHRG
jgi:hypothetical protein